MPLFTCPQCGSNVPDQAPTCPRCGQSTQGLAPTGPGLAPGVPAKKGMSVFLIVGIVLAVTIIPIVAVLAVLSIYGTRKYIANAKTAEARNTLGQIAKDAAVAFEREDLSSPRGGPGGGHRLCPSASAPIPADRSFISGKKYQSTSAEWEVDKASNAGFACLRFEMSSPQYYQYEYSATPTGFVARAYGDLNGDGVFSTFEIRGEVQNGRLLVAPAIQETNPFE